MIVAHFNPMEHFSRILQARVEPVIIKKGCIVAVKSIIMPGVTIGECAIVSAASVVYDNVEEKTLVRGNPALKVGRVKITK
jgi:acetyltransferase-like isoleucine patch superfamily enzyme